MKTLVELALTRGVALAVGGLTGLTLGFKALFEFYLLSTRSGFALPTLLFKVAFVKMLGAWNIMPVSDS